MSESYAESGAVSGAARPINIRHMRVESEFRRDTRRLDRQEREKYSSTIWNMMRMDPKPRVGIIDLVGPMSDNHMGYEQENSLKTSLDHYHRRDDRAQMASVLKFYCAYMMQQARKETELSRQLFSIFKATDLARMIVQYSPYAVSADAEAMVLGVFYDLGTQLPGQFKRYLDYQQPIYNMMKRLQVAPNDDNLRLEMARNLVLQRSYADAMVQYQYMLSRLPRLPRESDSRRGRLFIRIAGVFKDLAEYAGQGPEEIQDARKLKNFIERFNRNYAGRNHQLVQLQGPKASSLQKTARSLRAQAIRWSLRALTVKAMNPSLLLDEARNLAEIYQAEGRAKDALKLLTDGYGHWHRLPDTEDNLISQMDYLSQATSVAVPLRRRDKIEWANRETRDAQSRLNELRAKEEARLKKREDMFKDDSPELTR